MRNRESLVGKEIACSGGICTTFRGEVPGSHVLFKEQPFHDALTGPGDIVAGDGAVEVSLWFWGVLFPHLVLFGLSYLCCCLPCVIIVLRVFCDLLILYGTAAIVINLPRFHEPSNDFLAQLVGGESRDVFFVFRLVEIGNHL